MPPFFVQYQLRNPEQLLSIIKIVDSPSPLLSTTDSGLYCADGDFYVDPWQPVERALITHAHSDHARWGSAAYLTSTDGADLLRLRIGDEGSIQKLSYGQSLQIGRATVSFHPAGHILGSSQIRIERDGEVWVVSGDYKLDPDKTSKPFEVVSCDTFITESTFGLPIYRWQKEQLVFDEINRWWSSNAERGWTSIIYSYALGKSQRILTGLDPTIGPIAVHGAVMRFLPAYSKAGVSFPKVWAATAENLPLYKGTGLVIAPPSASGSTWSRKFEPASEAFASGWMQIRGARRRRAVDRGFVLSDHADWNGLLKAITATGAQRVGVTHGYTDVLTRYLTEQGLDSWTVPTRYSGDEDSVSIEGEASSETAESDS